MQAFVAILHHPPPTINLFLKTKLPSAAYLSSVTNLLYQLSSVYVIYVYIIHIIGHAPHAGGPPPPGPPPSHLVPPTAAYVSGGFLTTTGVCVCVSMQSIRYCHCLFSYSHALTRAALGYEIACTLKDTAHQMHTKGHRAPNAHQRTPRTARCKAPKHTAIAVLPAHQDVGSSLTAGLHMCERVCVHSFCCRHLRRPPQACTTSHKPTTR